MIIIDNNDSINKIILIEYAFKLIKFILLNDLFLLSDFNGDFNLGI